MPDSVKPNPSIPSSPILTLNLPVPSAATTSNGKRSPCNSLQQQLPPLQQPSPRYVPREVPPRFRQQEQRQLLKRGQPLPTGTLNPTSACIQSGVISPPETPTSKRHTGENHVQFLKERLRYLFWQAFHLTNVRSVNIDELWYFLSFGVLIERLYSSSWPSWDVEV